MSILLDLPVLIILGIGVQYIKIKFSIKAQTIRIFSFIAVTLLILINYLLFVNFISWPFNFFDFTAPMFESVSGKSWVLHSDLTNLTDISIYVFFAIFLLNYVWLFIGYEIGRVFLDNRSTVTTVKSRRSSTENRNLFLITGLIVGLIWESFGSLFLWNLSTPNLFPVSIVFWVLLGFTIGSLLNYVDDKVSILLVIVNYILALLVTKLFNFFDLITFKVIIADLFDIPLYMGFGWAFLTILLQIFKKKNQSLS